VSVSEGVSRRVCAVAYTHYRSDPRVRREAEALASQGDEVTVLALHEPDRPADDIVHGVRVIGLPVERYRGDGLRGYMSSYSRFFCRAASHLALRPRAYDLVHVHSQPEAMVFAATIQKIGRRPVVLDVHDLSSELFASRHGSAPKPVRWAERLSLAFADRVVTVHDDYRDRISARGVDPSGIAVVLNAPDEHMFPLRDPTKPRCPPRLIYHGTLVERYGLAVALRALASVRHRLPGVRLEIVGDGDFRASVIRLVAELRLGDVVDLSAGAVPIDAVPERIDAADIGLVPFVDDPFTQAILPTKLLEYVRMGKPVVVSRNPVIERYFSDDDVFFVAPGNADELAAAIERVVSKPEDAMHRARRAQRHFEREGWQAAAKARFLAVIDEVLDR
jgi:glycosyltransferase involved in cell wall biosynthesis